MSFGDRILDYIEGALLMMLGIVIEFFKCFL